MTEHAHHHHAGHSHDVGLAELLTLDAQVLGSYVDAATQWASQLAPTTPGTIVDVGAGSGAGTLALARRFPQAELVAVDKSAGMLSHTLEAARGAGVSARLRTVEADLDAAWPGIGAADLIWAASSLHELADPERTMADMFAALNPGGLLVVIEMDGLPRFLPDDFPQGGTADGGSLRPGLESRLHAALAQKDWNPHPDWQPGLVRAGFALVEQRNFPTAAGPTPELAARYARTFLGRIRPALEGIADPGDLAALDVLLSAGPGALLNTAALEVRGSRTAWAARKA
ncbi:SAM-dependent methyltransferase [Arthrobacter livingstonensis]|uniref:SAM-dependent methyltransferase n=1 Tax=Arthrobacter livingstonensis TaxID=670078 RepID=A0A2V5L5D4_9MICC|nr:class I SAM-dependent methyltransferase [Arthrobacter livingstonensis]PYI64933.1 SAM-dependent methyltransferase [Arthrobacter livingstonensis]